MVRFGDWLRRVKWRRWILSLGNPLYRKSSWWCVQAACPANGAAVQVMAILVDDFRSRGKLHVEETHT
ncbi:hypothetical protein HKD37_06G016887 [Glycine soja]